MMPRGFTLVETLVVMFILGIIASVALPDLSGSNSLKLDRAAEEVAMGLRYARDESVRTGEPHAFFVSGSVGLKKLRRIIVHKLNMNNPELYDDASNLYHPVSKQIFEYNFYDQMAGVTIISPTSLFIYLRTGLGDHEDYRVFFDIEGKPFLYDNSYTPDKYRAYKSGNIQLEYNGLTKSIVLEPGGRVSIQ